jgi:hypothetical protein
MRLPAKVIPGRNVIYATNSYLALGDLLRDIFRIREL